MLRAAQASIVSASITQLYRKLTKQRRRLGAKGRCSADLEVGTAWHERPAREGAMAGPAIGTTRGGPTRPPSFMAKTCADALNRGGHATWHGLPVREGAAAGTAAPSARRWRVLPQQ